MDGLPSLLLACGRWVADLTRAAAPTLALLPPTCKQAVAHTTMVCFGAAPSYYTPGFGPWPLAWGWCVMGAFVGALVSIAALLLVVGPGALLAARPRDADTAAAEVLRAYAAGGESEVQALAAQAGEPPLDMLCKLLAAALGRTRSAGQTGPRRRPRPAA